MGCFHGITIFKPLLYLDFSLVIEQGIPVLLKDAKNQSVDDEPAISPEQAEETLYLVEWNNLCEKTHDPILAEYHDFDVEIFEV